MVGPEVVIVIVSMIAALMVFAVVTMVITHRRTAGRPRGHQVPPPVDPGPPHPEQARDVNAKDY